MNNSPLTEDAYYDEGVFSYNPRMENWLVHQRCAERESGGIQCEKAAIHTDLCACPEALKRWMVWKYGTKTTISERISPK